MTFEKVELVVIGASAGGIDALNILLPTFKKRMNLKIAVVIHMPPEGPNLIPSLMGPICELEVSEAVPGEVMKENHIYISPNDYHLCVEPGLIISLSSEEQLNFSRPSIDVLFDSAAYAGRDKTVGILLTGANEDGSVGLKKIQEAGGYAIVQDPQEAAYPLMPESALRLIKPDFVLPLKEMAQKIEALTSRRKD